MASLEAASAALVASARDRVTHVMGFELPPELQVIALPQRSAKPARRPPPDLYAIQPRGGATGAPLYSGWGGAVRLQGVAPARALPATATSRRATEPSSTDRPPTLPKQMSASVGGVAGTARAVTAELGVACGAVAMAPVKPTGELVTRQVSDGADDARLAADESRGETKASVLASCDSTTSVAPVRQPEAADRDGRATPADTVDIKGDLSEQSLHQKPSEDSCSSATTESSRSASPGLATTRKREKRDKKARHKRDDKSSAGTSSQSPWSLPKIPTLRITKNKDDEYSVQTTDDSTADEKDASELEEKQPVSYYNCDADMTRSTCTDTEGRLRYVCDICDTNYHRLPSLKRHYYRTHINHKHIHDDELGTAELLARLETRTFRKVTSGDSDSPHRFLYACYPCRALYDTVSSAREHWHVLHSGPLQRRYECDRCRETCASKLELTRHRELHTVRTFACRHCDQVFPSESVQKRHEKIHGRDARLADDGERTIAKINIGGVKVSVGISNRQQLRKFQEACRELCHTSRGAISLASETPDSADATAGAAPTAESSSYACAVCQKSFSTYRSMCCHQRMAHSRRPLAGRRRAAPVVTTEADDEQRQLQLREQEQRFLLAVAGNVAENLAGYLDGCLDGTDPAAVPRPPPPPPPPPPTPPPPPPTPPPPPPTPPPPTTTTTTTTSPSPSPPPPDRSMDVASLLWMRAGREKLRAVLTPCKVDLTPLEVGLFASLSLRPTPVPGGESAESAEPMAAPGPELTLSGEHERPSCYVCHACGTVFAGVPELEEHKARRHPHVECGHTSLAGPPAMVAGDVVRQFVRHTSSAHRQRESSGELHQLTSHVECGQRTSVECGQPTPVGESDQRSSSAECEQRKTVECDQQKHPVECEQRKTVECDQQKHPVECEQRTSVECDERRSVECDERRSVGCEQQKYPVQCDLRMPSVECDQRTSVERAQRTSVYCDQRTPVECAQPGSPVAGDQVAFPIKCGRCTRTSHSLPELHRHVLECAGKTDWNTWTAADRRTCRRRHSLRSRLGLRRRLAAPPPEPSVRPTLKAKPNKDTTAESIERMLANLPAKRVSKQLFPVLNLVQLQKQLHQAEVPSPSEAEPALSSSSSSRAARRLAREFASEGRAQQSRPLRHHSVGRRDGDSGQEEVPGSARCGRGGTGVRSSQGHGHEEEATKKMDVMTKSAQDQLTLIDGKMCDTNMDNVGAVNVADVPAGVARRTPEKVFSTDGGGEMDQSRGVKAEGDIASENKNSASIVCDISAPVAEVTPVSNGCATMKTKDVRTLGEADDLDPQPKHLPASNAGDAASLETVVSDVLDIKDNSMSKSRQVLGLLAGSNVISNSGLYEKLDVNSGACNAAWRTDYLPPLNATFLENTGHVVQQTGLQSLEESASAEHGCSLKATEYGISVPKMSSGHNTWAPAEKTDQASGDLKGALSDYDIDSIRSAKRADPVATLTEHVDVMHPAEDADSWEPREARGPRDPEAFYAMLSGEDTYALSSDETPGLATDQRSLEKPSEIPRTDQCSALPVSDVHVVKGVKMRSTCNSQIAAVLTVCSSSAVQIDTPRSERPVPINEMRGTKNDDMLEFEEGRSDALGSLPTEATAIVVPQRHVVEGPAEVRAVALGAKTNESASREGDGKALKEVAFNDRLNEVGVAQAGQLFAARNDVTDSLTGVSGAVSDEIHPPLPAHLPENVSAIQCDGTSALPTDEMSAMQPDKSPAMLSDTLPMVQSDEVPAEYSDELAVQQSEKNPAKQSDELPVEYPDGASSIIRPYDIPAEQSDELLTGQSDKPPEQHGELPALQPDEASVIVSHQIPHQLAMEPYSETLAAQSYATCVPSRSEVLAVPSDDVALLLADTSSTTAKQVPSTPLGHVVLANKPSIIYISSGKASTNNRPAGRTSLPVKRKASSPGNTGLVAKKTLSTKKKSPKKKDFNAQENTPSKQTAPAKKIAPMKKINIPKKTTSAKKNSPKTKTSSTKKTSLTRHTVLLGTKAYSGTESHSAQITSSMKKIKLAKKALLAQSSIQKIPSKTRSNSGEVTAIIRSGGRSKAAVSSKLQTASDKLRQPARQKPSQIDNPSVKKPAAQRSRSAGKALLKPTSENRASSRAAPRKQGHERHASPSPSTSPFRQRTRSHRVSRTSPMARTIGGRSPNPAPVSCRGSSVSPHPAKADSRSRSATPGPSSARGRSRIRASSRTSKNTTHVKVEKQNRCVTPMLSVVRSRRRTPVMSMQCDKNGTPVSTSERNKSRPHDSTLARSGSVPSRPLLVRSMTKTRASSVTQDRVATSVPSAQDKGKVSIPCAGGRDKIVVTATRGEGKLSIQSGARDRNVVPTPSATRGRRSTPSAATSIKSIQRTKTQPPVPPLARGSSQRSVSASPPRVTSVGAANKLGTGLRDQSTQGSSSGSNKQSGKRPTMGSNNPRASRSMMGSNKPQANKSVVGSNNPRASRSVVGPNSQPVKMPTAGSNRQQRKKLNAGSGSQQVERPAARSRGHPITSTPACSSSRSMKTSTAGSNNRPAKRSAAGTNSPLGKSPTVWSNIRQAKKSAPSANSKSAKGSGGGSNNQLSKRPATRLSTMSFKRQARPNQSGRSATGSSSTLTRKPAPSNANQAGRSARSNNRAAKKPTIVSGSEPANRCMPSLSVKSSGAYKYGGVTRTAAKNSRAMSSIKTIPTSACRPMKKRAAADKRGGIMSSEDEPPIKRKKNESEDTKPEVIHDFVARPNAKVQQRPAFQRKLTKMTKKNAAAAKTLLVNAKAAARKRLATEKKGKASAARGCSSVANTSDKQLTSDLTMLDTVQSSTSSALGLLLGVEAEHSGETTGTESEPKRWRHSCVKSACRRSCPSASQCVVAGGGGSTATTPDDEDDPPVEPQRGDEVAQRCLGSADTTAATTTPSGPSSSAGFRCGRCRCVLASSGLLAAHCTSGRCRLASGPSPRRVSQRESLFGVLASLKRDVLSTEATGAQSCPEEPVAGLEQALLIGRIVDQFSDCLHIHRRSDEEQVAGRRYLRARLLQLVRALCSRRGSRSPPGSVDDVLTDIEKLLQSAAVMQFLRQPPPNRRYSLGHPLSRGSTLADQAEVEQAGHVGGQRQLAGGRAARDAAAADVRAALSPTVSAPALPSPAPLASTQRAPHLSCAPPKLARACRTEGDADAAASAAPAARAWPCEIESVERASPPIDRPYVPPAAELQSPRPAQVPSQSAGLGDIMNMVNSVLDGTDSVLSGSCSVPPPVAADHALSTAGMSFIDDVALQRAMGITDEEMMMLEQLGSSAQPDLVYDSMASDSVPPPPPLEAPSPALQAPAPTRQTYSTEELKRQTYSAEEELKRQHNDGLFQCPVCHLQFRGRQSVRQHLVHQHRDSGVGGTEALTPLKVLPESQWHEACHVCGQLISDPLLLSLHIAGAHVRRPASSHTGLKGQMSSALGRLFDKAIALLDRKVVGELGLAGRGVDQP